MAKAKVMSLSIDPALQDLIDTSAKKMGLNRSELIRRLVTKHLDLIANDGEEIPVILKIPASLKGDEEGLLKWLNARSAAIAKALK